VTSPMYLGAAQPIAETRVMPPDVQKAYDHYVESHWGDLTDTAALAETMYRAGGRHMLETTAAFSGIGSRLAQVESQIRVLRELWEIVLGESEA